MPIRLRLAALFTVATAVAVAAAVVVFVTSWRGACARRSSLDAALRVRADTIAPSLDINAPSGGPVATVGGQGEGLAQIFGPAAYPFGCGSLGGTSSGQGKDPVLVPRAVYATYFLLQMEAVVLVEVTVGPQRP